MPPLSGFWADVQKIRRQQSLVSLPTGVLTEAFTLSPFPPRTLALREPRRHILLSRGAPSTEQAEVGEEEGVRGALPASCSCGWLLTPSEEVEKGRRASPQFFLWGAGFSLANTPVQLVSVPEPLPGVRGSRF